MPGPWEKYASPQSAPAPQAPWIKYQQSSSTVDSSVPGIVRTGLGIAEGAAESMNPLAIPRGLEALGRGAGITAAKLYQGEGFHPIEALKQGEAESKLPSANISEVAAGIRTLGDIALHPSQATNIKNIFQGEKKAQEEFNNLFVSPTAKQATELGVGVLTLGGVAKDVLNATGLLPKISSAAEKFAVNSLKPNKTTMKILRAEGKVPEIGKELLNEGLPGAGLSWANMEEKVGNQLEKYGDVIDHFATTADKAIARDSSIRGVLVSDLRSDLDNKLVPALVHKAQTDVSKSVRNWFDENIPPASPTGEMSFAQAQDIKKTLKSKAHFGKDFGADTKSKIEADAYKALYGIVNDNIESQMESALKAGGSSEEIAQFLKAKEKYGIYKTASKVLANTLAGKDSNRMFSWTDYDVGRTAGAVEALKRGDLLGAITGTGAAIVNKLARERGNQATASFLNAISKPDIALESFVGPGGLKNADIQGVRKGINKLGGLAGSLNMRPKDQTLIFTEPSVVTPGGK
jgi:hypothetical protein